MRRYTGSISERLIREWGGKNRKSNKEKPRKQEETKTKFAMKRKNNFMDKKAYSVLFFFCNPSQVHNTSTNRKTSMEIK